MIDKYENNITQDIIWKVRNDYSPKILRLVFGGKIAYQDFGFTDKVFNI